MDDEDGINDRHTKSRSESSSIRERLKRANYEAGNHFLPSLSPSQEVKKSQTVTTSPGELSNKKAGLAIIVIFISSIICLAMVFANFPEMEEEDLARLRFPTNIDLAKDLGRVLFKYKDTHFVTVFIAIAVTYVFLQTFAIPGSIFLSILSGFLFPFYAAILLVCFCSAIGATFCYLLSSMIGSGLVKKWIPERLESWKTQVANHSQDILSYIIFLRITPFLPNWFINIASPIIGVPVWPFFIATFIGVAPPSVLFIRAGTTLYELTTATGHISVQSVAVLGFLAVLSLLPVLARRFLRS